MNEVVTTTNGRIRGVHDGAAWSFKGIPYGADTGGNRRFRPPQSPAPWPDVRDCSVYGPSCPQMTVAQFTGQEMPAAAEQMMGVWNHERETGEDCLVLNVWTRSLDEGARRPVLVWLHGGGMNTGSASWPLYDFTNLAHHNDTVVVSVNHRLGILGFLDLSSRHEIYADSGNVGMLDIVAALAWIRDNITAFGGDADNVTVFGESGGGTKVNLLLAMPAARGLFHRAFVMSGTALFADEPDIANDAAEQALRRLDCAPDPARLADIPVELLVGAEIAVRGGPRPVFRRGPRFTPTRGPSLPEHPIDAVRAHSCRDVELVVGCTTHEMLSFVGSPDLWTLDEHEVQRLLHEVVGPHADGVLDCYRGIHPEESPSSLYIAIMSDWAMRLPHIRLAEAASGAGGTAYLYLFAWGMAGPDGVVRSGHGTEMPFCFDNVERAPVLDGPHAAPLTNAMSGALVALARTGNPNHEGLPAWPGYDDEDRATMRLDLQPVLELDPLGEERRVWDTVDERELGLRA